MGSKKYDISDYSACITQSFRLGDRVEWTKWDIPVNSDNPTANHGTIRWIGKCKNDYTIKAVVEFDQVMLKSDNICNIFEETRGHGVFLPLGELHNVNHTLDLPSTVRSRPQGSRKVTNGISLRSDTPSLIKSSLQTPRSFRSPSPSSPTNVSRNDDLVHFSTTEPETPIPNGKLNNGLDELMNFDSLSFIKEPTPMNPNNSINFSPPIQPQNSSAQNPSVSLLDLQDSFSNIKLRNTFDNANGNFAQFNFSGAPNNAQAQQMRQLRETNSNSIWNQMVQLTKGEMKNQVLPNETTNGFQYEPGLFIGCKVASFKEVIPIYGQVRWMGYFQNEQHVGIEFDERIGHFSGWINGQSLFKCKENHGMLIKVKDLKNDPTYKIFTPKNSQTASPEHETSPSIENNNNNSIFQNNNGQPAESMLDRETFKIRKIDLLRFTSTGGSRGIQGKNNSCYIDAVLFSFFSFTEMFDTRLLMPLNSRVNYQKKPDTPFTVVTRQILGNLIIKPLRSTYYVSSESVAKLRQALLPLNKKITSDYLDVEEFMYLLFDKVYQLKEFISYDNGEEDFIHQIVVGTKFPQRVVTLQTLLETSLRNQSVKLKCQPNPAFILQIPRSSGNLIHLNGIIPNMTIKLNHLTNSGGGNMKLSSIICIKSAHFVCYVRCGDEIRSPWLFFDSNPSGTFPKIELLTKMGEWLEKIENWDLSLIEKNLSSFPSLLQRLLTDIYICIYENE